MMDGTHRVEFDDVHVVGANDLVMLCQIGSRIVEVSPHHILPGTTISGQGDRGAAGACATTGDQARARLRPRGISLQGEPERPASVVVGRDTA